MNEERMHFESWCFETGNHPQQYGLWQAWQASKTYKAPIQINTQQPITFEEYTKYQDKIIEEFRKAEKE